MRRTDVPHCRAIRHGYGDACARFAHPRASGRDVARRPFLQQELRRLDGRLGVEPGPHFSVQQGIGNGNDRHALMVRHEGADDRALRLRRQARARVVQCFVEAVPSARSGCGQSREVAHRGGRFDHRGERRGVRCDHGIRAQAALQPESRYTEIRVLIGVFQIAHVVGGFRNAPGQFPFGAEADLPADDEAVRLVQQAAGRCAHHQRRHQILEHRS
jgi:hypothetical protein